MKISHCFAAVCELGMAVGLTDIKEPRKIALTVQEAARLNALRRESARVYSAESRYEEQLLKAHGIKKPEYGDPCWSFVGIIVGEDAITLDQNAFSPECE